ALDRPQLGLEAGDLLARLLAQLLVVRERLRAFEIGEELAIAPPRLEQRPQPAQLLGQRLVLAGARAHRRVRELLLERAGAGLGFFDAAEQLGHAALGTPLARSGGKIGWGMRGGRKGLAPQGPTTASVPRDDAAARRTRADRG